MDAQEIQDQALIEAKQIAAPGSRKKLEALMTKKRNTEEESLSAGGDPVERMKKANPGLTDEKIMKMAAVYGF